MKKILLWVILFAAAFFIVIFGMLNYLRYNYYSKNLYRESSVVYISKNSGMWSEKNENINFSVTGDSTQTLKISTGYLTGKTTVDIKDISNNIIFEKKYGNGIFSEEEIYFISGK
ncbi:MAG TPA: hypothetical protein PLS66_07995, partial [Tepiditoga sp.]|nr:hypothetical protein [Tepiditoga sp.]